MKFINRIRVKNGKDVEVWKKVKKQIQPEHSDKISDTDGVASEPKPIQYPETVESN